MQSIMYTDGENTSGKLQLTNRTRILDTQYLRPNLVYLTKRLQCEIIEHECLIFYKPSYLPSQGF